MALNWSTLLSPNVTQSVRPIGLGTLFTDMLGSFDAGRATRIDLERYAADQAAAAEAQRLADLEYARQKQAYEAEMAAHRDRQNAPARPATPLVTPASQGWSGYETVTYGTPEWQALYGSGSASPMPGVGYSFANTQPTPGRFAIFR